VDDARGALRVLEVRSRLGVEVDAKLVGLLDLAAPGVPGMKLDGRHLHGPDDGSDHSDTEHIGGAPRGKADLDGLDPVRGALRQTLLVDLLAAYTLGIPMQHAGTLVQRTDDAIPHGDVVVR